MAMLQWLIVFARIVLILFNILLLILAAGTLALGIYSLVSSKDYTDLLIGVSVMTIIIGIILVFVSILGIYGAVMQNGKILKIYAVLALIIAIAQLALGIYFIEVIAQNEKQVVKDVAGALKHMQMAYNYSHDLKVKMDVIQTQHKCCGITNSKDWLSRFEYPWSCCELAKVKDFVCKEEDVYEIGCIKYIHEKIKGFSRAAGSTAIAFSFALIGAAAIAIYISCYLSDRRYIVR